MTISNMGVALTFFMLEMFFGFAGFLLGKLLWCRISEPKMVPHTRIIRR